MSADDHDETPVDEALLPPQPEPEQAAPALDADAVRDQNQRAWNANRYESWVRAEGGPEEAAKEIVADAPRAVRRLLPHLGDVNGARICNLQGSKGKIAIGLALLGAKVTVIDFAHENQRYALETAAWANTEVEYIVADVMDAPALGLKPFDAVVMELGILHYHQDLERFFAVCAALTKVGGVMVLNEFHPVRRKLFSPTGRAPDYFESALIEGDVPNPTGDEESLGRCFYRNWTLGEIVTAAIAGGFEIVRLDELPDWDDSKLPGMFTLVARFKP